MVGMAVGATVRVGVEMGKDIVAGAGVGVDAGAQAERMSVASKTGIAIRFIVLTPVWRSVPPNDRRISRSAERAQRSGALSAECAG
jgi:hypothetical protein